MPLRAKRLPGGHRWQPGDCAGGPDSGRQWPVRLTLVGINPETITIDDVLSAAKTGEPCLHNIYAHAGKVLGMGVTNLIRIFNPAKILISGKGVEAGEMLFASMYQTISRCLTDTFISDTAIRVQNWDRKDYARGAGTMVLQEIYKSPAHRNVPIV